MLYCSYSFQIWAPKAHPNDKNSKPNVKYWLFWHEQLISRLRSYCHPSSKEKSTQKTAENVISKCIPSYHSFTSEKIKEMLAFFYFKQNTSCITTNLIFYVIKMHYKPTFGVFLKNKLRLLLNKDAFAQKREKCLIHLQNISI